MKIDRAWIDLTTACNNRCEWCYANTQNKTKEYIDLNVINELVKHLKQIKCKKINLLGGEPTLHPDFIEILKLCNINEFHICVITNGRKFSQLDFLEKVLPFRENIIISTSIEGTRNIHNNITKVDSFNETINGLKNCIKNNIQCSVNTTLCYKNYNSIPSLYSELIELGVNNFSMNIAVPPINTYYDKNDYIELKKVNSVLRLVKSIEEENKINFVFTTPLPYCVFDDDIKLLISENYINVNSMCHIFNGAGIVFNTKGNLVLCTHLQDIIMKKDIKKIFDFDEYWDKAVEADYRKHIRKYPSTKCRICSFKNKCTGGCPVLWQFDFLYKEIFYESKY